MREHLSYLCKDLSDREHRELKRDEIFAVFSEMYLNLESSIGVTNFDFMREGDTVKITITFKKDGKETKMEAEGNGSLSAVNNALKTPFAMTQSQYTTAP